MERGSGGEAKKIQGKMKEDSYSQEDFLVPKHLIEKARKLRQEKTEAEDVLWQFLRNRKLYNYKFRRQHPLPDGYILDFYCSEAKVGIELDGFYHQGNDQKSYDLARDNLINERYGIRVIRFWNSEVEDYLETVLEKIVKFIRNSD